MITASASLSPLVVAQHVAENQLKHQVAKKTLNDKINAEAKLAATIVTQPGTLQKQPEQQEKKEEPPRKKIDLRL